MKVDKKDWLVLQALDGDVRASYAQIGRKTRLSKEVVQYRIKQLEKKSIITGYWAVPKIGASRHVYKLLLKNRSLDRPLKDALIAFCLDSKVVSWLAQTEGNWDFVISSYVDDDNNFKLFVNDLFNRFGTHLKEKHILKSVGMLTMNEKYLYKEKRTTRVAEDSFLEVFDTPDVKDQQIIRLLSYNARARFSEIAKVVGLTAEAVSARFRRIMAEKLVISANVRINHRLLGLEYYHLFISMSDFSKKDALLRFYSQHPDCVFIMKHIGYYDAHLELVASSNRIEGIIDELTGVFGNAIASYELLHIQKEHIMVVMR